MLKRKSITKLGAITVLLTMACSVIPAQAAYTPSVSVWDGSVNTNWLADQGITADSQLLNRGLKLDNGQLYKQDSPTIKINSAADFIAFRNDVCEGMDASATTAWGQLNKPYLSATVELMCDIDLNGLNLKYGIGGMHDYAAFFGRFDGNGHTIKNLKINPNEPDAAAVQPGPNARCGDTSSNWVVDHSTSPEAVGLFPYSKFIGDQDGSSIINLHLENVEITLPDTLPNETLFYAGSLAGRLYNGVQVASCSAKNVKFVGGPTEVVGGGSLSAKYLRLGGLIGVSQGGGFISNVYVNGVDYTALTTEASKSWTYLAGLCDFTGDFKLQNAYTANVTFDTGKANNVDTFCYQESGTLIPSNEVKGDYTAYGNKFAYFYSDNWQRYTAGEAVENPTYNNDITVKALTNDLDTATDWMTSQGGNIHMINMHDYTGEYPKTASERGVWGRNCKFYANGSEVTTLAAAQSSGDEVSVSFDTLNTTTESQTIHIILAKYQDTRLVDVDYETVAVPVNGMIDFMSSYRKFGRAVKNIKKDGNSEWTIPTSDGTNATQATSTITIDPSGCTDIMWSDVSDLLALSYAGTLN